MAAGELYLYTYPKLLGGRASSSKLSLLPLVAAPVRAALEQFVRE